MVGALAVELGLDQGARDVRAELVVRDVQVALPLGVARVALGLPREVRMGLLIKLDG
jgi:hypothetical protein